MVSERDAVLRERDAFKRGAAEFHLHEMVPSGPEWGAVRVEVQSRASERYPLPKVKRRRIVADPHGKGFWRVGLWTSASEETRYHVEQSDTGNAKGEWVIAGNYGLQITDDRVRMWSDLLANPFEECEDTGAGQ